MFIEKILDLVLKREFYPKEAPFIAEEYSLQHDLLTADRWAVIMTNQDMARYYRSFPTENQAEICFRRHCREKIDENGIRWDLDIIENPFYREENHQ